MPKLITFAQDLLNIQLIGAICQRPAFGFINVTHEVIPKANNQAEETAFVTGNVYLPPQTFQDGQPCIFDGAYQYYEEDLQDENFIIKFSPALDWFYFGRTPENLITTNDIPCFWTYNCNEKDVDDMVQLYRKTNLNCAIHLDAKTCKATIYHFAPIHEKSEELELICADFDSPTQLFQCMKRKAKRNLYKYLMDYCSRYRLDFAEQE